MGEAKRLPQFFAAISVCIGAFSLGTVIAWTANITDELKAGKLNDIIMDNTQLGWVGSLMPLGAVIACFPVGFLQDTIGRKKTALLTVIPYLLGWCLITFASNVEMVYAGRFLSGVGGGSFCVVAPVYNSEIAEVEIRGMIGTFFQLFITVGILYVQVLGYIFSMFWYNIACLIIPIIFGVLFVFQPESPVTDIKKGNDAGAEKSFNRLRGTDYDHSGEVNAIKKAIEEERNRKNFFEAMKAKSAKRATLICLMLMFYQQLSGINAVMFYASIIFIDAGSTLEDKLCTISIGIVQVFATVVSALVVDRFGRKILLIISAFFMGVGTFFLGLFFSLKNHKVLDRDSLETIGWLPVLSLNIFIIAFSLGFGPIPWLASGEMFTEDIKGKLSATAATFNWLLAFGVTKLYPTCAENLGNDITFYFFTAILVSAVFFILAGIPETKGKTEAEIKEMLGGG